MRQGRGGCKVLWTLGEAKNAQSCVGLVIACPLNGTELNWSPTYYNKLIAAVIVTRRTPPVYIQSSAYHRVPSVPKWRLLNQRQLQGTDMEEKNKRGPWGLKAQGLVTGPGCERLTGASEFAKSGEYQLTPERIVYGIVAAFQHLSSQWLL